MESRFGHLRQRDASVSMLRVKMSRRRSQSQKENRERAVNTRRQLNMLPELEISSLGASIMMGDVSSPHEKTMNNTVVAKKGAAEERMKQLARWRERKILEKEKEKREKASKGVFKTGMYHPKDTFAVDPLPLILTTLTKAKETKANTGPSQSSRVTRSMKKQQQVQGPLKTQDPNAIADKAAVERSTRSRVAPIKPAPGPTKTRAQVCKDAVKAVVTALTTRSAKRPPGAAAPVVRDNRKERSADIRTTRSKACANAVAPPSERERKFKETVSSTVQPTAPTEPEQKAEIQVPEEEPCPPSPTPCSESMGVDQAQAESVPAVDPVVPSFAPEGFVFQAPTGLSFRFDPLTPRSADAFLTPSLSFSLPPAPVFNVDLHAEPREPSPPEPVGHSPHTSPTVDPLTPASPLESKFDVPYFRSEIANETDRLTNLCVHWKAKVEDESIPEEMRDRMRTAVGQARLLMKERFKQFSGLVDDCELGRGEKITTCTDLQGFWDMVFYQVEDVKRKFDALEEAERQDWVEEHKPPPPRQKKVVKKQSAAPAKPTGTKAVAKSRLAAVKAAMKAKQQAAKGAGNDEDGATTNSQDPHAAGDTQTEVIESVLSPAKPTGLLRRSSRLSGKVLHQASPCSNYPSPRRVTRRSVALAQTPVHAAASPAQGARTPPQLCLNLTQTPAQAQRSQHATAQSSRHRQDAMDVSLCFSPFTEVLSDNSLPKGGPECQSDGAAKLSAPTPVHSPPSISVVEGPGRPAEAVNFDLPVSPCKTPPVSQAPGILSCQGVASPLLVTPKQPPMAFSTVEDQDSACHTPDSPVVEDAPGFDIERYLRPSQTCGLSPGETVAAETMSLDGEMESPSGETEDLLTHQKAALPKVSPVLTPQSPQAQTAESALLLFTPDLKDRIRQSVCPSDLMVFTPPI